MTRPKGKTAEAALTAPVVRFEPGPWSVAKRSDYHDDRVCDCHSSLDCFIQSIPLYHAVYVAGSIVEAYDTEAKGFGHAFHTFVLERDKWEKEVFVYDKPKNLRGGQAVQEKKRLYAMARGRSIVTCEDFDKIRMMTDAMMANPEARDLLLSDGPIEQPVRWYDEATGLALRSMLDKVIPGGPAVDLKTADDPSAEAFAKACGNFGYHRQDALYQTGRAAAYGRNHGHGFRFVVVGKKPPYECVVYQLGTASLDLGHRQNAEALAELRDCKDFNIWHGRGYGKTHIIELPRWHFYKQP